MELKKVSQVLEETYSVCTVCTISRLQSAVCMVCVLGWPKEMRVRKSIYKLEIIFSPYVCPTDVPDVSWELWQFFWEKPEVGWLAARGTWLADNSIALALCTRHQNIYSIDIFRTIYLLWILTILHDFAISRLAKIR